MGYQITFAPSEEKMKEYKPWNENQGQHDSFLEDYKRELVHYCMKKHDKTTTIQLSKDLAWKLRCLYGAVEQDEKLNAYYRWKNDEHHWLWYCGWEFSHDSYFEKDSFIEQKVNDLLVFTDLIETPNYFEDSENFYKKLSDVREEVEGTVEIFQEIMIHNIIEDLREFELKDDDEEDEKPIDDKEDGRLEDFKKTEED